MAVDSFKYLPRSFRAGFEGMAVQEETTVWSPLAVPIEQATVALLTSAGLYLKESQPPFDVERERQEPTWGDPTYRVIPRTVRQEEVSAEHLHLNTRDFHIDFNVALPIRAFGQLEADGAIGGLADEHYGFMGFQDHALEGWREHAAPEVARRLKDAGVHALVLAPA
ncbi:MAG: glycine/sarcosine/betaine reductase selenoprotein B family protein [Dehalococcoidia bacterium]|jgi:D-proline reductase (dithiol) PrdB|nr:glycine/sarcosine/betaine reductase selenoprotein B family protein [Dehalococcoidia bacterium]